MSPIFGVLLLVWVLFFCREVYGCEDHFYLEPIIDSDSVRETKLTDLDLTDYEHGLRPTPPTSFTSRRRKNSFRLNTGNASKYAEFSAMFGDVLADRTSVDLPEPDSDPLTIITYKASQFPEEDHVIVEDTSLHVEGEDVGANIKWLLNDLDSFVGKSAIWQVLLAYREGPHVKVFEGIVHGKIVTANESVTGFGFDPYFQPDLSSRSLADYKIPRLSARWAAVKKFFKNEFKLVPIMPNWDGAFQKDD